MTQPSKKRRQKRRAQYKSMLVTARLVGVPNHTVASLVRGTPNSHNIERLQLAINVWTRRERETTQSR